MGNRRIRLAAYAARASSDGGRDLTLTILGETQGGNGYEVVLTSGRVLRLPPVFDSDQVSRLITAVESC